MDTSLLGGMRSLFVSLYIHFLHCRTEGATYPASCPQGTVDAQRFSAKLCPLFPPLRRQLRLLAGCL